MTEVIAADVFVALERERRETQARCDRAARNLSQGPTATGNQCVTPALVAVGALGETDEEYEARETGLVLGVPAWRREELKAKHAVEDEFWTDEPEDEEIEESEE